jgi:hypothetical protein
MNDREKEVYQAQLDAEKAVLKNLEKLYQSALDDIDEKIKVLQSDELTQSKIYQVEYQKALRGQIAGIVEKLHGDEYTTIQQYLHDCYTDAFVGTMYDIHGQGIPLILPIDQNAAVKAIQLDSKINEGLYKALGVDATALKKTIQTEVSRGIATGLGYAAIARNISNASLAPRKRAMLIARTESHRITQASTFDAQKGAKKRGCDVLKQWDATMDGDTRPTHRQLDGQLREIDKPFEIGNRKAMFPGDFGDPAEDCNCRCVSNTRVKWDLDEDELETLKERAKFFGLDKTEQLDEFKKKYMAVTDDWVSADAGLKKHLKVDARDKLSDIVIRSTVKLKQGISAFPADDILFERVKLVEPEGNLFDVAMHGSPTAVSFGGTDTNMSPRLLASVIRHSEEYHGQDIRLIACSTGQVVDGEYCFAEELANALGVTVYAPNDLIFIADGGNIKVGRRGSGSKVAYKPNERKRLK